LLAVLAHPWLLDEFTDEIVRFECRSEAHSRALSHMLRLHSERHDLGFTYRTRKNGDIEVLHHGRVASTLRGTDAMDFLAEVESGEEAAAQQLMARVTGNYKRGNERLASQHPRNRR
jgi:hypothetical protein